jgi:Protein of unknown function (DUF2971)
VPRTTPPPRLYKYQPFNARTLENLANRQIWFNAPSRFNDPFDCALPFFDPSRLTDADYLRAYQHQKERMPTTPRLDAKLCPNGVPSQEFRDLIVRSVTDVFETQRKTLLEDRGVTCFSAKPLDITMWSHYADGHRGFSLEFDTSTEPWRSTTFRVRYADAFPYVNPIDVLINPIPDDPENDLLIASVLTKAACWQYEEEWRAMHMEPNKRFGYDFRILTGIYFGAAMPTAHKGILSSVLRDSPTQLYQVQRDEKGFALKAVPVKFTPNDYK